MSLEYTIDIQLTELGFPDLFELEETPVKESPSINACTSPEPQEENLPSPSPSPPSSPEECLRISEEDIKKEDEEEEDDGLEMVRGTQPIDTASCSAVNGQGEESGVETEDTDDSGVSEREEEDEDEDEEDEDLPSVTESDGSSEHRCGVCSQVLPSGFQLHEHMNQHMGERPYCCAECGKRFCQLANYRVHLRTHAQPKPLPPDCCRICRKSFHSEKALRQHLNSSHFESEFYECDVCKFIFTDRARCEEHIKWHMDAMGSHVCPNCGGHFRHGRLLKRHMQKSCCKWSYACCDCPFVFKSKNALLKHSFSHLGLLPYTCVQCRRHFRLARHYKKHKCEPDRIQCVACLGAFVSQEDFQKHKKDTGCWGHQGSKGSEIRCMECGESFASVEEQKRHAGAHQRVLTCFVCGKGFRSSLLLMSHMGGHASQRPYLCQKCGMGFPHQQDYDSHLKNCGSIVPQTMAPKKTQTTTQAAATVSPPQHGLKTANPGPSPGSKVPIPGPSPGSKVPTPGPSPSSKVPTPGSSPGSKVPIPGSSPGSKVPIPGSSPGSKVPIPGSSPGSKVPIPGSSPGSKVPIPGSSPGSSPGSKVVIPVYKHAPTILKPVLKIPVPSSPASVIPMPVFNPVPRQHYKPIKAMPAPITLPAGVLNSVPSQGQDGEGLWKLSLDKNPPPGVKLVVFVPSNSRLASGLSASSAGPETPASSVSPPKPPVMVLPPAPTTGPGPDHAVYPGSSPAPGAYQHPDAPLDLVKRPGGTKQELCDILPLDLSMTSPPKVCLPGPPVVTLLPSIRSEGRDPVFSVEPAGSAMDLVLVKKEPQFPSSSSRGQDPETRSSNEGTEEALEMGMFDGEARYGRSPVCPLAAAKEADPGFEPDGDPSVEEGGAGGVAERTGESPSSNLKRVGRSSSTTQHTVSPSPPLSPSLTAKRTVSPSPPLSPSLTAKRTVSPSPPLSPGLTAQGTVSPSPPLSPSLTAQGTVSPLPSPPSPPMKRLKLEESQGKC